MFLNSSEVVAQDATWLLNPPNNNFDNTANWSPATVPTGTASFGASNLTNLTFSANTTIGTLQFNAGAPTYSFGGIIFPVGSFVLAIDGRGVVNNSSSAPLFNLPGSTTAFVNSSIAGNANLFANSGALSFRDTSSAANATITTSFGLGMVTFSGNSTAGRASITNNGSGGIGAFPPPSQIRFTGASSAGFATIANNGGDTIFLETSTASAATIINNGGNTSFGTFGGSDRPTAAVATIVNNGGATQFVASATAGSATITNNAAGRTFFQQQSTAGNATITTNSTAQTFFLDNSDGGTARLITNTGGTVDISRLSSTGMAVGSIEGAGSYILGAKALTVGSNNLESEVSGTIQGDAGSLIKIGSGTLTLSGANTYTGPTTINAGTLAVNGTIQSPVGVSAGGTLAGLGSVGAVSVADGGIVAPGAPNTIGTLRVSGDFAQARGGTLAVEVRPNAASRLAVGGSASLGGRLVLLYDPGVYTARNYTILNAQSITGSFAGVSGNTPSGFSQSVGISPTDVQLQLANAVPPLVPTPPPILIAPTNDTIFPAVSSTLVLNGQRLTGILLNRLGSRTGGIADGPVAANAGDRTPLRLAQAGNIAALGDFAAALPRALAVEGAWFRGIGGFASVNRVDTTPGFNASSGGFLAGFDRPVAANLSLGVAVGYLHSDANEHTLSNGRVDSGRVAVYGGGWWGPSLLTGTAGYAYDRIATGRSLDGIGNASQGHDGHEFSVAGQWSLPLPIAGIWGKATLTLKLGVQYLHLYETAFKETGASGFNLSAGANDTDSVQPFVGLAASERYVTVGGTEITPELRLGYSREVASNSRVLMVATLDGTPFLTRGVRPSRDLVTAGAGLTVRAQDNLFLYANYDAVLHTGNTSDQTVSAGIRIRF